MCASVVAAAATYPPQDADELGSAAESLATTCDLLSEECPAPATAGDGGAVAEAASAALQAALDAVHVAQGELAQALGGGEAAA